MTIPFVAFGNEELGAPIKEGELIVCESCRKHHPVKYALNELKQKTNMLMYYKCGKKSFLVGVADKLIPGIIQ